MLLCLRVAAAMAPTILQFSKATLTMGTTPSQIVRLVICLFVMVKCVSGLTHDKGVTDDIGGDVDGVLPKVGQVHLSIHDTG